MAINGKIWNFNRMESGFKIHYETDDSAIGPQGSKMFGKIRENLNTNSLCHW